MKKNQKNHFLRSLKISMIALSCLCLLFVGFSQVYEQMQIVSFGEYKRAVEISAKHFRFFDFIIFDKC